MHIHQKPSQDIRFSVHVWRDRSAQRSLSPGTIEFILQFGSFRYTEHSVRGRRGKGRVYQLSRRAIDRMIRAGCDKRDLLMAESLNAARVITTSDGRTCVTCLWANSSRREGEYS